MAEHATQKQTAVGTTPEQSENHVRKGIGWIPWRLLLFMLAVPLLLHLFGLFKIPFAPFTTRGTIYVDSPEVYTRERLVNDRYDQDYWLREQLKGLDNAGLAQLIARRTTGDVRAAVGAAVDTDGKPATNAEGARPELTFDQSFRIVSGVRDMIRQLVLENMLDDRHDLSGNSVYGLKFDTTVIPGDNTRQRAFVQVTLEPDELFAPPSQGGKPETTSLVTSELSEHLNAFVEDKSADIFSPKAAGADHTMSDRALRKRRNEQQKEYYEAWLTDIAKRLNKIEDSLFDSMEGCPGSGEQSPEDHARGLRFYDELTRRTLLVALGIPAESFAIHNLRTEWDKAEGAASDSSPIVDASLLIKLPEPWARFMQLRREQKDLPGESPCRFRVWFNVDRLHETYRARRRLSLGQTSQGNTTTGERPSGRSGEEPNTGESTERGTDGPREKAVALKCPKVKPKELIQFEVTEDREWEFVVEPAQFALRLGQFAKFGLKYALPTAALEKLANKRLPMGIPAQGSQNAERVVLCINRIPSGFFNFVEHMSKLDAYSYAIFPKNDVVGVLADTSMQLSGSAGEGGVFSLARHLVESRTISVSVGYGDGRPKSDGDQSIRFGWVISSVGGMQPTLKTQLALVSVPAWTNTLHLKVVTGWLDNEGEPTDQSERPVDITINVPPDFEAFDSILQEGAGVTRGPRIQNDEMDKQIYVVSGKRASILIPGSRLWRSASVTLGAQPASRIRVLPNMEGIIAEFPKVELPYAAYNPRRGPETDKEDMECLLTGEEFLGLKARPVRLRVWTSEGVTAAKRSVCVVYDPRRQIRISGDR